jgi:hypothetical protein
VVTGADLEKAIAEMIAAGLRDDQAASELGISTGAYRRAKKRALRARRRLPYADR